MQLQKKVDCNPPIDVFEGAHLKRLIDGARNMFPPVPKPRREPITRDLLLKILPDLPTGRTGLDRDNANVYAAFCIAFAGFMRMGEFEYSANMASNKGTRPRILRRSDINFAADSNTATLLLRRSKTTSTGPGSGSFSQPQAKQLALSLHFDDSSTPIRKSTPTNRYSASRAKTRRPHAPVFSLA
jgi:hypothetical protein